MTDDQNRRLVMFSKFAGYAGMIDGLHGLGQRLLVKGYATPFLVTNIEFEQTACWDDLPVSFFTRIAIAFE